MTVITPETITDREIIVTVETFGGGRAKKYIIDARSEDLFFGLKTGKLTEAEGTPALDDTVREPSISDIRFHREDQIGSFHFGCQEVKTRQDMLCVNEQYRNLSSYEIVEIKLVSRDKIDF